MIKRLLWWLGYCDLVWIYSPPESGERFAQIRILYCDTHENKYVKWYGDVVRLSDDGKVPGYFFYKWNLYKPGNKPRYPKLRFCKKGKHS